jgi:arginyl-tRNA synthetase
LRSPEKQAIRFFAEYGGGKSAMVSKRICRPSAFVSINWYSEQSLYDRGEVESGIALLKERGLAYEKDGALWFRTTISVMTKIGCWFAPMAQRLILPRMSPITRKNIDRGFDQVIDVWGADHHGYVPRMKAMLAGLGRNPDDLRVILVQLVNLLRGGQQVAMSTRSGEFVTLREVIDEVGRDACRFFFLMRRSDSQLDFRSGIG